MDKIALQNQLTKWANTNGYSLNDMIVSHGGACVLHGLRTETNDIDLHVSSAIWLVEMAKGNKVYNLDGGTLLMNVEDNLDIHVGGTSAWKNSTFDTELCKDTGIRYSTQRKLLLQYRELNRAKDQVIISTIAGDKQYAV